MKIPNTHESTGEPPKIKHFLNSGTLRELPEENELQGLPLLHQYQTIRNAGFVGMQDGDPAACRETGLHNCGSGRINHASEVLPLVESHMAQGFLATTLHVGWGSESDAQIDKLVSKIIDTSARYRYPLYVETHRATITQDSWRTVQIVERFPEIRFNGDFSHWYTGHEMVYGDWEQKLDFIQPVLERVRFIHGRIATPGSIQAPVSPNPNAEYIKHFQQIWRRCFEGFLRSSTAGDFIIFAPELLPASIYYAQTYRDAAGITRERSDRWQDALALQKIADTEFANAVDRRAT